MTTENRIAKLAVIVLMLLMFSSAFIQPGSCSNAWSSVEAPPLSPTKDYGNILQYEWSGSGGDENQSGFSAGPGPNSADVLWKVQTSGSGVISVFNGKAFVLSGTSVKAFDAFTGAAAWTATLQSAATGNGGTTKIDEMYFFVDTANGIEIHKISDGTFVSKYVLPYMGAMAGSGNYFPGSYSSTLKMKYITSYNPIEKKGYINGVSYADPTRPQLAWSYVVSAPSEIVGYGGGKLYVGTTASSVVVLDGTTGAFLYETPKSGVAQQHGFYYDGNFYHGAASQTMTCWDGNNGDVLWEFDSRTIGTRAFYAYRGAAAFGRVYDCAVSSDPHGWVCSWDAKTGELLWKQPAYYNIHYATTALADGKVYAITCDQAAGSATAGLVMPGYGFACYDAFSGTQIWNIPNLQFATPSVAYGNLYGSYGGYIYCIGQTTPTSTTAKPWSYGFTGNIEQPRVAVGQSGPRDLSHPRWVFATGAKISSSAAVVDGKVYVGSEDNNWYCLNAYTGAKIWNFTTGYKVGASAAVIGGKVYTGADDGYFYCLDANTGEQLWKTNGGGLFTYYLFPQELQSRSSPIIVGDSLYAGAMDGKVYCLNTANGNVKWTYTTGGPIGGSPAYSNGVLYIASTDTFMYALDAASGVFKWKTIGLNLDIYPSDRGQLFCTSTPTVAAGKVFVECGATFGTKIPNATYSPTTSPPGGSKRLAAFNATTGALIWNVTQSGNSGSTWVPTYMNGIIYNSMNMRITANNATNGALIWEQWVGYQILSSVAYADNTGGPIVYICSDVGSISCFNATSGKPLSAYQTPANVECSPTIWEGKLYVGSGDRNIYCFDDSPIVDFNIFAAANKDQVMWNNETITLSGLLTSNPNEKTWNYDSKTYVDVPSEMHPAIPSQNVTVSFTKPDMTSVNLTTTTDNKGKFTVSFNPTEVGDWGWVAYFEGNRTTGLTYKPTYTQWNPLTVAAAPVESTPTPPTPTPSLPPTPTPTPTETPAPTATPTPMPDTIFGLPAGSAYLAVGVIVVIAIIAVAYVYTQRRKKPKA